LARGGASSKVSSGSVQTAGRRVEKSREKANQTRDVIIDCMSTSSWFCFNHTTSSVLSSDCKCQASCFSARNPALSLTHCDSVTSVEWHANSASLTLRFHHRVIFTHPFSTPLIAVLSVPKSMVCHFPPPLLTTLGRIQIPILFDMSFPRYSILQEQTISTGLGEQD